MIIIQRAADFIRQRLPARRADVITRPKRDDRIRTQHGRNRLDIHSRAARDFLDRDGRRPACREELHHDFVGCAAREGF